VEETNELKLKAGKRYKMRNGFITPPLKYVDNGTRYNFEVKIGIYFYSWLYNGKTLTQAIEHKHDLIEEFNGLENLNDQKYHCNNCKQPFNKPKLIHDNEDYEHCPHCESDDFDLMQKKV